MNPRKPRIVVVGSTNVDFCSYVERLPQPGETIGNGVFMQANGGKGANQAVAAARLGGDVCFVTSIGTDTIGDEIVRHFQSEGIDCSAVFRALDTSTGIALIVIDSRGENIITVNPGANAMLTCDLIDQARGVIADADALMMQAEIPYESVKYAAQVAREAGVPVIYNPAPVCVVDDEMMSLTDVMILNETEATILSGCPCASDAARQLLRRGVGNVIITLGSKGAFYSCGHGASDIIPSYKVEAVDSVGAGDTFCGAVAVAFSQRKVLDEYVLRYATAAAAISVTRHGAQPSIPSAEETLAFISEHTPSLLE
ncbi:MAG: ribokinase [Bacteroidaceae bacterium]